MHALRGRAQVICNMAYTIEEREPALFAAMLRETTDFMVLLERLGKALAEDPNP